MKPWEVVTKEMDGDQKISLILEGENDRSAKIEWERPFAKYCRVGVNRTVTNA